MKIHQLEKNHRLDKNSPTLHQPHQLDEISAFLTSFTNLMTYEFSHVFHQLDQVGEISLTLNALGEIFNLFTNSAKLLKCLPTFHQLNQVGKILPAVHQLGQVGTKLPNFHQLGHVGEILPTFDQLDQVGKI